VAPRLNDHDVLVVDGVQAIGPLARRQGVMGPIS
jgi:hypothetical protein